MWKKTINEVSGSKQNKNNTIKTLDVAGINNSKRY